jgi:AcrR family transcriptional regulator
MTHQERKLRQKEQLRQSILDAAKSIAAKDGWHAVTIRKIADKIQYTPPIVYEYFKSKEALLKELVYSGFRILGADIVEAKKSESDARHMLLKLSLIHWDFAFSHRELFQLMFSLERPPPNEQMISMFKAVEDLFLSVADNDEDLSQELQLHWVSLSLGAISIFMNTESPPPHFRRRKPRKAFEKMIQRFISAI